MSTLHTGLMCVASGSLLAAGAGWWRLWRLQVELGRLRHAATHDVLTGLANRVGLADAWLRLAGVGGPVGVLVLDLDGFKPVNDRYGHAAGDAVLVTVAARLRRRVPGVVARLGGDEFAILTNRVDPAALAYALAGVLVVPVRLADGRRVSVAASVGVTTVTGGGLAAALACADAAMYRAKTTRVGVAVYQPRVDDRPAVVADPRPAVRVRDLVAQSASLSVIDIPAGLMTGGDGCG